MKRLIMWAVLAAGVSLAQTPVRILDTLMDGQGRRINATLTISWGAFVSSGNTIPAGSTFASVTNGNLDISLVPNSISGIPYIVRFPSPVCQETWLIPISGVSLGVVTIRQTGSTACVNAATGGGSGAVASVFTRVGAVVAAEADYQAFYPLLSGAYPNPSWITSLAWAKVTQASQTANTAFLAPNGSAGTPAFRAIDAADIAAVSLSAIPAILTGKQAATALALAADPADCGGADYVKGINAAGVPVCSTPSGGGGATAFSGLTDCRVTRASAVYTVAACSAELGGVRYPISAATATLSGASGASTLYLYLDETGINVGHVPGATIACSGCTERTGITAFPARPNIVQLATATYTLPSTFADPTDLRSAYQRSEVEAGGGNVTVAHASGRTLVDLAASINLATRTTVPNQTGVAATRTAIATCSQGQTFMQTDATTGLYAHLGTAGACSWTAPAGGGGITTREYDFYAGSLTPGGALVLGPGLTFAGSTGVALSVVGSQPTIAFTDATTSNTMDFDLQVPTGWTSGATLSAVGMLGSGAATVGQVARYSVQTICIAAGEDANSPTFNTAQVFDFTQAVVNGSFPFQNNASLALTTTGCAAGETLRVRVAGDRTAGADTVAATHHWRSWKVTL